MKQSLCGIFFMLFAGAVLTGCEPAEELDGGTRTLKVHNRSSVTIKDIKWSDETFTNNGEAMLVPGGSVETTVSTVRAKDGRGYLLFNSTADLAFRTREAVSFANSDTFTFTDNTVVVELSSTANTGTLVKILSIPVGIRLNTGDGRITVNWAAVEGASSYNVYYAADTTPPEIPAQTGITGTSALITGLANGRTYSVWVQSVSNGFVSALSGIQSITTPIVYTAGSASAFAQAITGINSDIAGTYAVKVTGDFAAAALMFAANADKIIIIEGDGANRSITNNGNKALFTVPDGTGLILDNNITLRGNGKAAPVVEIETGGTLTMNSGSTITGAKMRGVYINGGVFNMTGGTISGNSISAVPGSLISLCFGGGVFVESGSFTMSGGAISGNSAYALISDPGISAYCFGGGVFVFGGSFTMSGGTISGNTASLGGISAHAGDGGGVYMGGSLYGGGDASFTMSGGSISGNSASTFGGGVFVESGTFILSGGTISANTAANSGGGAYIANGTTFTMSGGSIRGNTAVKFVGGGVAVESEGFFLKTGGAIDANAAVEGKAVYAGNKKRDAAAGPSDDLNSHAVGSEGGWE